MADSNSVIRASITALSDYIAQSVTTIVNSTNLSDLLTQFYTENPEGTTAELIDFMAEALSSFTASEEIANLITAYKVSVTPPTMSLSDINVDFEAIKADTSSQMASSAPWKDDSTSAIGQTLINAIATAITYETYNVIRSAGEAMIPTAVLDSSIYCGTRHLGVRIARSTPATCTATVTYTGVNFPYTIDAYTQFYANNIPLFNRDVIIIMSNDPVSINLYEGSVNSVYFTGTGENYQTLTFGNSSYEISDKDVIVSIDGTQWSRTDTNTFYNSGIWNYTANDTVYIDDTTADGNVEISFGNGTFGIVPSKNSSIDITYVTTEGLDGNSLSASGNSLSCTAYPYLSGSVTSTLTGGANPLSANDYKKLSPARFSVKNGVVTNTQYNSIVQSYPGVVDGYVIFQKDYAPDDITKMMQAKVVLLTSSTWTANQQATFIEWLEGIGISNMTYTIESATPIYMNLNITIGCVAQSNLTTIEGLSEAAVTNMFTLTAGVLGYSRYLSDVEKAIAAVSKNIDYIVFSSDSESIILSDKSQYVVLGSLNITTEYSTR